MSWIWDHFLCLLDYDLLKSIFWNLGWDTPITFITVLMSMLTWAFAWTVKLPNVQQSYTESSRFWAFSQSSASAVKCVYIIWLLCGSSTSDYHLCGCPGTCRSAPELVSGAGWPLVEWSPKVLESNIISSVFLCWHNCLCHHCTKMWITLACALHTLLIAPSVPLCCLYTNWYGSRCGPTLDLNLLIMYFLYTSLSWIFFIL